MFGAEKQEAGGVKRLETLLMHLQLYHSAWGASRPFPILKRFFKIYISDFRGAAELRKELMDTKTIEQAKQIVENALKQMKSSGGVISHVGEDL